MLLRGTVPLEASYGSAACTFTLHKGESAVFTFGTLEQKEQGEIDSDEVHRDLEARLGYWREWSGKSAYKGRWRDAVNRSALTLKMLTSRRYGSLVAALTFGMPEHIGGSRNLGLPLCLAARLGVYPLCFFAPRLSRRSRCVPDVAEASD